MRRLAAVALAVALVLSAGGLATAHGNAIEVDSQVSGDGTVLVENVLLVVDGFVVVHRTGSDGRPGEAIGHAELPAGSYESRSVRVSVDETAWSEWGDSRTVWVVIHRDEGDAGFDPREDPVERSFGSVTGEQIALGKAERESSVVAEGFSIQRTATNAVTVRRAALARDGLLAVELEGDGRVVGATALEAGVHENVSVGVDGSVFASAGRRLTLVAALYDGDGPTVDDGDRPFRVGGEPIRTTFTVERTGSLASSGTASNDSSTPLPTTRPLIVTATPDRAGTDATGGTTGAPETASGPGFGGSAAVAVFVGTLVALSSVRRRGS